MKGKKPGTVIIKDRSNSPNTFQQPKDCHCHCSYITIGKKDNEERDGSISLIVIKNCGGRHKGKGGWWKNEDCLICKS